MEQRLPRGVPMPRNPETALFSAKSAALRAFRHGELFQGIRLFACSFSMGIGKIA